MAGYLGGCACCAFCIDFRCDESIGSCHSGVGWIQVENADGVMLYEDCPSGQLVGPIKRKDFKTPVTITVQYSESQGPCPGGHCCNAAVFNLFLVDCSGANADCDIELGQVDLNNYNEGSDEPCANPDRGPFTFTVSEGQVEDLISCLNPVSAAAASLGAIGAP